MIVLSSVLSAADDSFPLGNRSKNAEKLVNVPSAQEMRRSYFIRPRKTNREKERVELYRE